MGSLFGNPSNASSSGASAEGSLVIGAWVNHSDHMSKKMTASDIKAKIFAVLDGVAAGDEVEITKHGRIVAKLVPARGGAGGKGMLEGVAMSVADEEQLFTTGIDWNMA